MVVRYGSGASAVTAASGVSLRIERGAAVGLVGESGSGKTTVGRAIMGLAPITAGRVRVCGVDVAAARGKQRAELRRRVQMIFQDPAGSLSPRQRVWWSVAEPMRVQGIQGGEDRAKAKRRACELLERVGISADQHERFPHALSGGQRQRVAIARAISVEPSLVVCDEPTSALDVSVQAQVVNLLMDLRAERGIALLFISHDIAVVDHVCERIAVMQAGRLVEVGDRDQVTREPREAYTRRLLDAVPRVAGPDVAGPRTAAANAS